MIVRLYTPTDKDSWDSYVLNHPDSTHCHLSGWKCVSEKAYGHKGYYLLAEDDSGISGILPLIHIKSFFFGNQLVSIPFMNYGGILADSSEAAEALTRAAIELCTDLKASEIELRHLGSMNSMKAVDGPQIIEQTHKVRMLLDLPATKDELLKSFKSKLRSQISRPQKEGITAEIGGAELIDRFYHVFSVNMRDLGSPVHSKRLFTEILREFPDHAKIALVSHQGVPVAAGLIFSFMSTVEIPWASSLRKYSRFSPNMLLYWALLEYSCDCGAQYFDFGRSTPDEGTYKFKEQWGAKAWPLHWYSINVNGNAEKNRQSEKSRFKTLVRYWKKLPMPVSTMLGPLIRKNISL